MPGFLAEVLTWPSSYASALAVETAMKLHMPPSVFMFPDRQPTEPWTAGDKKLALAWTILERETCGQCGKPIWICRSSNKNLLFSVRTDICYASAEVQKFQDTRRGKNLKKGEYPYVVPKMRHEGDPLPTRADYLKELDD